MSDREASLSLIIAVYMSDSKEGNQSTLSLDAHRPLPYSSELAMSATEFEFDDQAKSPSASPEKLTP